MNNSTSTNTTDDSTELTETQIQARIAEKNANMTPEQQAAFEAEAAKWQPDTVAEKAAEIEDKQDQVLTKARTELASQGMSVDEDKVEAIVTASEVPDKNQDINQVTAQVKADAYGAKLNNVGGGANQGNIDAIVNQIGAPAAAQVKELTLQGHTEEAGRVVERAVPPEQTADEARADITKALNGEGDLSAEQAAAADVLGVDTEQAESGENIDDIEQQIAEIQERAAANNVINFEDLTKLQELQNKLIDLKTKELSTPDMANLPRLDADVNRANEIAEALRHAQELAGANELEQKAA